MTSGGVLTTSMVGQVVPVSSSCSCIDVRETAGCRFGAAETGRRFNGACAGDVNCRHPARVERLGLCSSFTKSWQDSRLCTRALLQSIPSGIRKSRHRRLIISSEFGGQYEESFGDVQKHLLDFFTYKAVRTVLAQLSEMNPHQYAWFYNYVVNNKPQDSKNFLRLLVKERQELGERVMVTRLHLFNKWVKKYNHADLHKAISDQNLELLRERLIQTVKFSDTSGEDNKTTPPP